MPKKANSTEMLRYQNRALVLGTLRENGSESHTGISDSTGLSSSTVSTITAELEDEGILQREEQASPGGRGRPRLSLGLNPDCAYVVTVRITAMQLEFSLVDYCGTLKDRFLEPRDSADTDVKQLAKTIKQSLEKIVRRADVSKDKIYTISITTRGLVAEHRPVLLWSPVLEDRQIDFQSLLEPDWHAGIRLNNETCFTARAIADRTRRSNLTSITRRYLTLSLGDSIGLGIATQEKNGSVHSFAPPFGHMTHQTDGPLCRCGSTGCVEAIAGFYGILRMAFDVPANTIPARFIPFEQMSKIADRARKEDRSSAYAFRIAGETLGAEISRLQSIFGPMPVTITGTGAAFFDLMQEGFTRRIGTNLLMRFVDKPPINLAMDESELIFEGNARSSLQRLDDNLVATRKLGTTLKLA